MSSTPEGALRSDPLERDEGPSGSQEVTQRLLATSVRVFGESGFEAARVSDIARLSGLTTGAVYSRWPSKRDLFLAAVNHVAPERMARLVGDEDTSATDRLVALSAHLFNTTEDQSRALLFEACVTARRNPEPMSEIAHVLEAEAKAFAAIIREGKATKAINPELSTDALVLGCQALSLGFHLVVFLSAPDRQLPTADEWTELFVRIIGSFSEPSEDALTDG